MFAAIILILMAWFVEMPLWLSILATVICGVKVVAELLKAGAK